MGETSGWHSTAMRRESEMVATAEEMIEDCHFAVRGTPGTWEALLILAKRDALSELIGRVKFGRRNGDWTRVKPTLTLAMVVLALSAWAC